MISLTLGAVFGNWPMWGGDPTHQGVQLMKGAMDVPVVKWSYQSGNAVEWQFSAVEDVDGDGRVEVVMGNDDGVVFALDGATGGEEWRFQAGDRVESAPAVGDVDGDGTPEVVFGCYDKNVYCLNGATGEEEWHYSALYWLNGAPTIADVDGDGREEVLITSRDTRIYCLNGEDGSVAWFYGTGNSAETSPAVADVNGDGQLEVLAGSRDGRMYCLRGSDGALLWSFSTGSVLRGSPAAVDVNRDGRVEVLFGSGNTFYCLRGSDGALLWSFSPSNGEFQANPSLANVDDDRAFEVFVGNHDSTLYCLDGATGELQWSQKFPSDVHTPGALVDIDGDDQWEVLVPQLTTDTLYCLNAENGSLLWKMAFTGSEDVHAPFSADLDADGCAEVIVATHDPDQQGYRVFALDDPYGATNCGQSLGFQEGSAPEERLWVSGGTVWLRSSGGNVSLEVYDLSGRLYRVLFRGKLPAGEYSFEPSLKGGAYLVVLREGDRVSSAPLLGR